MDVQERSQNPPPPKHPRSSPRMVALCVLSARHVGATCRGRDCHYTQSMGMHEHSGKSIMQRASCPGLCRPDTVDGVGWYGGLPGPLKPSFSFRGSAPSIADSPRPRSPYPQAAYHRSERRSWWARCVPFAPHSHSAYIGRRVLLNSTE